MRTARAQSRYKFDWMRDKGWRSYGSEYVMKNVDYIFIGILVDAYFKNYLGAWIWISSNVGDLRRTCIGCEHSLDVF